MNAIPDDILEAATAKYQELIAESEAFTLDVQSMLTGIREQVKQVVAAKIPQEYGLEIEYLPQENGEFRSHAPHMFILRADGIQPIRLRVSITPSDRVETEITVQGVIFTDLLTAIGFAHKLFEDIQNSAPESPQEFIPLEQ